MPEARVRADKPIVLVVCDLFLPGCKGGGPIQTLANLVDRCRDSFRFSVITHDRDHLDAEPYPGVKADEWQEAYGCEVMYVSPGRRSVWSLRNLIDSTPHDIIYLNSFFSVSTIKVLALWQLGLIRREPVILAPRGQFSAGALRTRRLKHLKKAVFIGLSRVVGLHRGIVWQATNEMEKEHILNHFRASVVVVPNLPARPASLASRPAPLPKRPGQADFVFVSRVSVMKNLDYVLELLQQCAGRITFDIYGPVEDAELWSRCTTLMNRMPPNVAVRYGGELQHDAVAAAFARHHFFLFPTRGENYGHVVIESLAAGCPVIMSDQTPWRDLEQNGAGWDIPLADRVTFRGVIQRCVDMDSSEYTALSRSTRDYGLRVAGDEGSVAKNRSMFLDVLARSQSPAPIRRR